MALFIHNLLLVLYKQAFIECKQIRKSPILENGHAPRTRNAILVENTTAFDVISHMIVGWMVESEDTKNMFLKQFDSNIMNFFNVFLANGACHKTYVARTAVLKEIYPMIVVDGLSLIKCSHDVKGIVENFFFKYIPSAKCTLIGCDCFAVDEKKVPILELNLNFTSHEENKFVLPRTRNCDKCGTHHTVEYEMNNIVFVDPIMSEASSEKVEFNTLPRTLIVQSDIYMLAGVVEIRGADPNQHYVAHVLKPNRSWYELNNIRSSICSSKFKKGGLIIHLLIYVHST